MQVELRNGEFRLCRCCRLWPTPLSRKANAQSSLQRVATTFRAGAPQIFVNVNRIKAETLGVTVGQLFAALSDYVGSNYVGQITKFGHVFQIYAQADAKYRANVDDIRNLKVKAGDGTMTPIGTVVDIKEVQGPSLISLYNLYPSATIVGGPAPGSARGRPSTSWSRSPRMCFRPGPASNGQRCPTRRSRSGRRPISCSGLALMLVYFVSGRPV